MTRQLHELVIDALAGDPGETAMESAGSCVPWQYLAEVAARVDALLTEAQIGPATPIGLVPRNRPGFAATLLSLIAARRSIVMVYAFQSPQAIAADLARLDLPAVIADAQDWTADSLAGLGGGTLAIALASDWRAGAQVSIAARPVPGAARRRDPTGEPMIELLTSGTTGAPKRAPIRYATLERAIIAGSVLGQGGDAATVNFPISNISGIYSYLPMAVTRRLVLFLEKFDLALWLDFVCRHRPALAVLPPAGVRMMLDADLPPDSLAGVHYIAAGTTAIDPAAHRAFEERFGVPILLSYGATEFAGAATTMTPAQHAAYGAAKFGSVGRPSGDNEVRIVDPVDDRPLSAGEIGLIEVKVPHLGPDFIRTTDLGRLDDDGFLFHHGRADGVIVRGGFKILPASVEGPLNAFPGVAASCVVGVAEPRLGQVPVAVIEMQRGVPAPGPKSFETYLRATLPATYIPVAFHVVPALPRTPSLKIDLKEVKAFAARAAATRQGAAA